MKSWPKESKKKKTKKATRETTLPHSSEFIRCNLKWSYISFGQGFKIMRIKDQKTKIYTQQPFSEEPTYIHIQYSLASPSSFVYMFSFRVVNAIYITVCLCIHTENAPGKLYRQYNGRQLYFSMLNQQFLRIIQTNFLAI